MWQRRYPFAAMGSRAAGPFAVAGFLAWWVLAVRVWHSSPGVGGPAGAVIAGLVAFHVYSSQGPQRPASSTEAAVADGVVAGVIASVATAVLFALGAGSPGAGRLAIPLIVVACGVGGAAVGALLGWGLALTSSDELLRREPPRQRSRHRRSKSARRRRR